MDHPAEHLGGQFLQTGILALTNYADGVPERVKEGSITGELVRVTVLDDLIHLAIYPSMFAV